MDITGTLAKLLATENLTVVHKAGAPTASFNVKDRILTLPVFQEASQELLTMLAAHEVGHALQTPQDWTEQVITGTPFDFVNVIEDVRIEKFIQNKFPGLRRDFSRGYSELDDKDFFGLQGEDINKMSLIDRLNLHFKLGYRAVVGFSDDEQQWVQAIDECDTFQKVCLVAKMLSDWLDEKAEDQEELPEDTQESQPGQSEEEEEDKEEEQQQGSKGRKGDEEETPENEEDEVGEQQPEKPNEKKSLTQQNMQEEVKKLANTFGKSAKQVQLEANTDLSDIIGISDTRSSFDYEIKGYFIGTYEDKLKEFLSSTKKEVNHMVQRFEMKKSADAYSRATVNKTGVLNTGRLHEFKLTDDIFLRQTTTPDGKNHGMVMFLDWSGSMSNHLLDTVKQVITLVQFCQKVQIPFEVYTFTTGSSRHSGCNPGQLSNRVVQLVQVITSTAKKNDLKKDILNLFSQASYLEGKHSDGFISQLLSLGGTPLDNALVMVPSIIDRFRKNTGAQIVSFVALTDGQSSPLMSGDENGRISYGYYSDNYLRFGHQIYKVNVDFSNNYETSAIVDVLKKVTTDVSFTNIFIGGKSSSSTHLEHSGVKFPKVASFIKEGGVSVTPDSGWDLITCLNPKNFNNAQEEIEVEEGAKKGAIKVALKKFLKSQSTSKVILDALADQFS